MLRSLTYATINKSVCRYNHEHQSSIRTSKSEEADIPFAFRSFPGCISEGETIEEALTNIQEAIELYLEPIILKQAK